MATTLLGPDALRVLLAGRGTLRVANRTAPEDGVVIVAAAVVRHRSNAPPLADATFRLELEGAESLELEEVPPAADKPEQIEVLLRLRVSEGTMVDAYVTASKSASDPDAGFEVGVRRHDGVIVDGEDVLSGFAEFAVYGQPVG